MLYLLLKIMVLTVKDGNNGQERYFSSIDGTEIIQD